MKYSFLLLFCLGSLFATAQQKQANWFTDQTEAITYATAHDQQILMVFAGSDWCRPCIQFKKDILESEDFKTYAEENLVVLYLDFPGRRKNKLSAEATAHNEALAETYNQSGTFPKIVLLDHTMNKVKDLTYQTQTPTEFVTMIK